MYRVSVMVWTCEYCASHRHFGDKCLDCGLITTKEQTGEKYSPKKNYDSIKEDAYQELFAFINWTAKEHPKVWKILIDDYTGEKR